MLMNIKELKEIIHEVLRSDITDFELEHTSTRLKLHRGPSIDASDSVVTLVPPIKQAAFAPAAPLETGPATAHLEAAADDGLHIITSPIVGTFYSAPAPGAEAFVKIGQMVEEGATLCIVEAMKLMNEIPSDMAGEVARIYVENGNPVEYGQKLMGIRPRR
jgi:acetyl-CoA carboxylase biotin carboxyl carrier protein